MANDTPIKSSAFSLYISFTLCSCSTTANHRGLVTRVVRNINLNQSIAEKSNFPYHKIALS